MAINDYITCCKCDVKLIYDGGKDNNRQWWEERWGKEPEILCPDCEKKLEPVAWGYRDSRGKILRSVESRRGDYDVPLYTAPPHRKPLSDEQRDAIARQAAENDWHDYEIIDAVEAAHGIKE